MERFKPLPRISKQDNTKLYNAFNREPHFKLYLTRLKNSANLSTYYDTIKLAHGLGFRVNQYNRLTWNHVRDPVVLTRFKDARTWGLRKLNPLYTSYKTFHEPYKPFKDY